MKIGGRSGGWVLWTFSTPPSWRPAIRCTRWQACPRETGQGVRWGLDVPSSWRQPVRCARWRACPRGAGQGVRWGLGGWRAPELAPADQVHQVAGLPGKNFRNPRTKNAAGLFGFRFWRRPPTPSRPAFRMRPGWFGAVRLAAI